MKNIIRYLFIALIIFILIFSFRYFGISKVVKEKIFYIFDWIQNLGTLGPIVFIILYILATIFLLSGALLTLGAGALFGIAKGVIITSIGSIIGATLSFLIARYLVRGWISHKIEKNLNFIDLDNAVAKDGWKIVGLTRLSPVLPFVLLNYSFGITKVSLRDFFFASWLCMLPGITLYAYIGSLFGNLASIEGGKYNKSIAEWVFYIIGLIATLAVTIYITIISKKILEKKIKKV